MNNKENPFSYKEADDSTGFLLWRVHNYWQREIRKCLNEFGLTHTQFVVLASTHWLNLKGNNITQVEIAHHAKIDVMMTSNVIRALEKKKLLTRMEHETDTRAKVVFLTNDGIDVLKKSVKKVEDFDKFFFSKLSNSASFNEELINLVSDI